MRDLKEINRIAYECNQTGESLEAKLTKEEMYEYMYESNTYETEVTMNTNTNTNTFITAEQAKLNEEQYINKLAAVTTWQEFYAITKTVEPILTSDNCKTKFYFFPKGGMKKYWAIRKAKAAELSEKRTNAINKYLSEEYLKEIKGNKYETNEKEREQILVNKSIPNKRKQELITKIDQAICDDFYSRHILEIEAKNEKESEDIYDQAVAYDYDDYYATLDEEQAA